MKLTKSLPNPYEKSSMRKAQFHISKFNPEIYMFIKDGFLLIPSVNFTQQLSDGIHERNELRTRLIEAFKISDPMKFQNNNEIKIYSHFISFSAVTENFFILTSLYEPDQLQQLVLDETRESLLACCPIHSVVMASKAAQDALKEFESDEFCSHSSEVPDR